MWICTTKLWWWNVEKFLNKDPLPWVQLIWEKYYSHSLPESKLEGSSWWKSHLKLLVEYNKSSVCKLGNGQATLLWHDNWLDQPLKERFPELLSFAKSDSLYVHDWNRTEDQIQLFHTPLSTQAYNQFTQMQNLIQLQQNEHVKDTWTCNSQKSKYSSITMYHHLCQQQQEQHIYKWLWKSSCRLRNKIFFWLLLHDRVNTRNLLKRKYFPLESYTCVSAMKTRKKLRDIYYGIVDLFKTVATISFCIRDLVSHVLMTFGW